VPILILDALRELGDEWVSVGALFHFFPSGHLALESEGKTKAAYISPFPQVVCISKSRIACSINSALDESVPGRPRYPQPILEY
jgi:hypothetical protein